MSRYTVTRGGTRRPMMMTDYAEFLQTRMKTMSIPMMRRWLRIIKSVIEAEILSREEGNE